MGARWVAAHDLFDDWSREEDALAFARAGGHAYDFALTPPARGAVSVTSADDEDVDEFALEEAELDAQTTATLRIMAAEMTDTMALLDDEVTGTLPAMA